MSGCVEVNIYTELHRGVQTLRSITVAWFEIRFNPDSLYVVVADESH